MRREKSHPETTLTHTHTRAQFAATTTMSHALEQREDAHRQDNTHDFDTICVFFLLFVFLSSHLFTFSPSKVPPSFVSFAAHRVVWCVCSHPCFTHNIHPSSLHTLRYTLVIHAHTHTGTPGWCVSFSRCAVIARKRHDLWGEEETVWGVKIHTCTAHTHLVQKLSRRVFNSPPFHTHTHTHTHTHYTPICV